MLDAFTPLWSATVIHTLGCWPLVRLCLAEKQANNLDFELQENLDHAADQLDEVRGVVVGALLVEDHVACHLGLVVEHIIVAVEDVLSLPHAVGNDATK